MKLEDIAKIVIKDLEALEKEQAKRDENLRENLQNENLANENSQNANLSNQTDDNFDDDLSIYSDIVLPERKKENSIAFNFHFESINFSDKKSEEVQKPEKKDDFSDEISDLANEKYDFADEKIEPNLTTENLAKPNSLMANFDEPSLPGVNFDEPSLEKPNLAEQNLQNEFENLENEDFSQNIDEKILADFAEDLPSLQNSQNQTSEFVNLNSQNQTAEFNAENPQNLQTQTSEFIGTMAKIDELLANLDSVKKDEARFLSALKERILVLFEGLNSFEGDLEARVELSIKFMEFLLASIDNRVENLSK